jgi:hypothetical protein
MTKRYKVSLLYVIFIMINGCAAIDRECVKLCSDEYDSCESQALSEHSVCVNSSPNPLECGQNRNIKLSSCSADQSTCRHEKCVGVG